MKTELEEAITETTGINVHYYKEKVMRNSVEKRMNITGVNDPLEYATLLKESDEEARDLTRAMTIGFTRFFRHRRFFERLADIVEEEFPEDVYIWSPGCSTGEEPYTIAMEMKKRGLEGKILATDINEEALLYGREGLYYEDTMENLTDDEYSRFFEKGREGFHIADELKDVVEFEKHDVISGKVIDKFDIIVCRNTLKFFTKIIQKTVFINFHMSLVEDGILGIGRSENMMPVLLNSLFEQHDPEVRIYRKISN